MRNSRRRYPKRKWNDCDPDHFECSEQMTEENINKKRKTYLSVSPTINMDCENSSKQNESDGNKGETSLEEIREPAGQ